MPPGTGRSQASGSNRTRAVDHPRGDAAGLDDPALPVGIGEKGVEGAHALRDAAREAHPIPPRSITRGTGSK